MFHYTPLPCSGTGRVINGLTVDRFGGRLANVEGAPQVSAVDNTDPVMLGRP